MKLRQSVKICIVAVALVLVFVALYSGLQVLESTVFYREDVAVETTSSKTITRDGVDYFPRQDITVLLIMGIDQEGPVQDSMSYNNEGEADVVMLAIFDEVQENYTILALNRDTMLDIPILGLGGKQAGTKFGQLALSHTYGSGLKDSCENTKSAVSNFLGGIYIDYYVAMNMDAVPILNDAVGGVRVNVADDFDDVDPSIQPGEMILKGQQALNFVQIRKGVGNQMNVSRMERQRGYMNGFVEALDQKLHESNTFVLELYEEVSPYIVSDCSVNTLSALVNRFSDFTMLDIVSPEGENILGKEFMEFYADEEALDNLVLQIFYAKK